AGLKANLAAARDLPRQLRLRGLAGQIVVDFAPMGKKERRTVEQAMNRALRQDTVETNLVGWTPLGHMELQRKRDRIPLTQLVASA
ncbi:MAG TPA: ribonuclease G, partial [Rhodobacteraceae bacterium]|nr:ribonuclease G [Paracoccaceae bacterium]